MELGLREKDKGRNNLQGKPSAKVIGDTAITAEVSYNMVMHMQKELKCSDRIEG